MRSLRLAIAAIGLVATTAFASPTAIQPGVDYTVLAAPQPVQTSGKKVEVIEFFMYHCPHCHELEPELAAWIKRQGDNINFRRVHFPYAGPTDPEARLYLTLEAMGKLDLLHDKVFHAFHVERKRLMRDDVIIDWVAQNGVDKAKFLEYWNSFGVLTKLKRLGAITTAYTVQSAPTLVVDGRYMTSPSIVGAQNKGMREAESIKATVQVLDGLVAKVIKDSGGKPAAPAKTSAK